MLRISFNTPEENKKYIYQHRCMKTIYILRIGCVMARVDNEISQNWKVDTSLVQEPVHSEKNRKVNSQYLVF